MMENVVQFKWHKVVNRSREKNNLVLCELLNYEVGGRDEMF